jgi:hypothetical protein
MESHLRQTFNRLVPDEGTAHAMLVEARWGGRIECQCGSPEVSALRTKPGWWQCRTCRHQFSVRSGSALHRTRKPLRDWLYALWASATAQGISARRFTADVGYARYRTGWGMLQKVRATMEERDDQGLDGRVCIEVGWFFIGRMAKGDPPSLPPVFVARATEISGRFLHGSMRLDRLPVGPRDWPRPDAFHALLMETRERRAEPGAKVEVMSLEQRWIPERSPWGTDVQWTSLLAWVHARFGGVSRRYLQHYLAQFVWVENRRKATAGARFFELMRRMAEEPFLSAAQLPIAPRIVVCQTQAA